MGTKQAGIERPYTFSEFLGIVEKLAAEQKVEFLDKLDYFIASEKEEKITSDDIQVSSVTDFGGCEGIYSDFTINMSGENHRLFTAKTLYEDDESFIKMHIFAVKICLIAKNYIWHHREEFNWTGFDVGCIKDGKTIPAYFCYSKENAIQRAYELKEKGLTPVIRDNETRKILCIS